MTRNEAQERPRPMTRAIVRAARRLSRVAGVAILAGTLAYCGGDNSVAARPDSSTLFWSLSVSDQAVALAVGETLQITATPRYSSGAAIPDLPTPTFTSQDSGKVTVDANGVLHAVATTSGVQIIASLQAQGITHADTIIVAVTATATPVATFSIHPIPPDSAVVAFNSPVFINATIQDANGNDIPGIPFAIQLTDSSRIGPLYGMLYAQGLGPVGVIATTNAYGVRLKDSVEYRVGYMLSGNVSIDSATSAFLPSGVKIAATGSVTWYNGSLVPASVTFDDPAHVDGGNITTIAPGDFAMRTFPTAGTYTYHGSSPTLTGRVLVY